MTVYPGRWLMLYQLDPSQRLVLNQDHGCSQAFWLNNWIQICISRTPKFLEGTLKFGKPRSRSDSKLAGVGRAPTLCIPDKLPAGTSALHSTQVTHLDHWFQTWLRLGSRLSKCGWLVFTLRGFTGMRCSLIPQTSKVNE